MTATYIALATITLTSTDSEIVFSSIPATYRDLVLVYTGTNATGLAGFRLRLNGDTTSVYSTVNMNGDNNGNANSSAQTETSANLGVSSTGQSSNIVQIFDYAQTNKQKTMLARGNSMSPSFVRASAGRWANTAAVTSVTVSTFAYDFNSGSTFSLYGIN